MISEIPTEVKQQSDAYIQSKLGGEDIDNYVRYKQSESIRYSAGYQIVYEFLPLQKYTTDNLIKVSYIDGSLNERLNGSNWLPDCRSDTSLCEFNLTLDDFKNKLSGQDIRYVSLEPPYLAVRTCLSNVDHYLWVDYRSGEMISEDPFGKRIKIPLCTAVFY